MIKIFNASVWSQVPVHFKRAPYWFVLLYKGPNLLVNSHLLLGNYFLIADPDLKGTDPNIVFC